MEKAGKSTHLKVSDCEQDILINKRESYPLIAFLHNNIARKCKLNSQEKKC
jgi:hypothetical protein